MYGRTLSALAVLIMIALGVTVFAYQSTQDEGKTYKNSVYGYTLIYPADLDVKEYGEDNAVFGIITDDAVEGRAEVRVITAQGEAGQTLQDAVADQLKNLCAADGPTASFSCTDTTSTEPFTTANAEQGYVLMLKGELVKRESSSTPEVIPMGPYYVVPLSNSATISKVVVVMPPLNQNTSQAHTELVRTIAESVRLTQ